jgi:hypothetical protein
MFKKIIVGLGMLAVLALGTGCERIETGKVGVRVNASKQIQGNELVP